MKPNSSRSQFARGVFPVPGIPAINSFIKEPVLCGNVLATADHYLA
jgi:hypothetical protein